jgi:hypothetical protein
MFGNCWLILKRSALGEVEALGDSTRPANPVFHRAIGITMMSA